MFVCVGKEANDVIAIGRVYRPNCGRIGRVASVLAELLGIGRFVAYMIRTVLLIANL